MVAVTTASMNSASARQVRAKEGSSQGSSQPGARFSSTEATVKGKEMRGLNSAQPRPLENTAAAMAGTSRMAMGRNKEVRSSAGSNAAARAVSALADTTAWTSSTALKTGGGMLARAGSVAATAAMATAEAEVAAGASPMVLETRSGTPGDGGRPKPANWSTMNNGQRRNWLKRKH